MLVVVLWFPEVGLQGGLQHLLAVDNPRGKGVAVDGDILRGDFLCGRDTPGEDILSQDELLTGNSETLLGPGLGILQTGLNGHCHLIIVRIIRQFYVVALESQESTTDGLAITR